MGLPVAIVCRGNISENHKEEHIQQTKMGRIKITILLLSLVQMATAGLSPMLSKVSEFFPDVSTSSIQFLMTIPGIFVVIFALISAWISRHIRKRTLICIGACFILVSGILAFFLHGNMMLLLFCFISGSSISMIMPQCMNQVSQNPNPPQAAFAIALVMAGSNLGTFLTPVLSKISAAATGSEHAAGKFLTSAVFGCILFVVYVILVTIRKKC